MSVRMQRSYLFTFKHRFLILPANVPAITADILDAIIKGINTETDSRVGLEAASVLGTLPLDGDSPTRKTALGVGEQIIKYSERSLNLMLTIGTRRVQTSAKANCCI